MHAEAKPDENRAPWLNRLASTPPEEWRIDVSGAEIHYRLWDGPSALPGVMLVHGMNAHSRWWDPIAPYLAEDRRVAALDLSGMGDSGYREQYSDELYAEEIIKVAQAAGLDGGIIVAHSYGGGPAVVACLEFPDLFSRLVMLDSRIPLPGRIPLVGGPTTWDKRVYATYEEAVSRFRLTPPGFFSDPDVFAHIAQNSVRSTEGGWTWKFDHQLLRRLDPDAPIDPSALSVPMTFIRGECSIITTPDDMVLDYRYFPDAEYLTLPLSGHHLMIDQPLALVAMLRGILGRR